MENYKENILIGHTCLRVGHLIGDGNNSTITDDQYVPGP